MTKTTLVFIALAVLAVLSLVGRLIKLFRQSRRIEASLDYEKMKKWDDEDDWPDAADAPGRDQPAPSDPDKGGT